MKLPEILISLLLFCLLLAACAGATEPAEPAGPPNPEGPALIMFYTDN